MKIRGSWILPLLLLAVLGTAGLADAGGRKEQAPSLAMPYRDLPGVKRPEDLRVEGYNCTTELRYVNRRQDFDILGRDFPQRVYRCERNGVVHWGTEVPRSGGWFPGINPRTLPRDWN